MYRCHQFGEASMFGSHPLPGRLPRQMPSTQILPRFWSCNPFLAATRPQSHRESKPFGKEGGEHSTSQPGFLCTAPNGNSLPRTGSQHLILFPPGCFHIAWLGDACHLYWSGKSLRVNVFISGVQCRLRQQLTAGG